MYGVIVYDHSQEVRYLIAQSLEWTPLGTLKRQSTQLQVGAGRSLSLRDEIVDAQELVQLF